jgi:hypothetical protein
MMVHDYLARLKTSAKKLAEIVVRVTPRSKRKSRAIGRNCLQISLKHDLLPANAFLYRSPTVCSAQSAVELFLAIAKLIRRPIGKKNA